MASRYTKDPDAVLDYSWDWSQWLEDGETIASYEVTVPSGLTLDDSDQQDGIVTAWLSGGTAGSGYAVVCHVVTSIGREDDRSISIRVTER